MRPRALDDRRLFLRHNHLLRRAQERLIHVLQLHPSSSLTNSAPVSVAISSSIAFRRSPKPEAFTAQLLIIPRSMFTERRPRGALGQFQKRRPCRTLFAPSTTSCHPC